MNTLINKRNLITFGFYILLILLWEVACLFFQIDSYFLPSPSHIITTGITNLPIVFYHTSITFFEAIIGLLLAIFFGLSVSILMFEIPLIRRILFPLLKVGQTIPIIAIAPLFIIWFGIGYSSKIFLIASVCSFPIIITSLTSFENSDRNIRDYLKTINCSTLNYYRYFYLPENLPQIFSGIKISATYAMISALFSEYIGATAGLGLLLNKNSSSYNTEMVFVIIITLSVITLALVFFLEIIEKKMIKWRV